MTDKNVLNHCDHNQLIYARRMLHVILFLVFKSENFEREKKSDMENLERKLWMKTWSSVQAVD